MDPLKVYNIGQLGVQLVASPLHQKPAVEVIRAQNAVYDKDSTGGGLRKRPGMSKLNAIAMSGGSILGGSFVAFADPSNPLTIGIRRGLYIFENTGGAFLYTDNVSSWNSVTLNQAAPFPVLGSFNNLPFNTDDHIAPIATALPGRTYFFGATGVNQELWRWNGSQAARVLRPPAPPQSGAGAQSKVTLTAIYNFDGAIYLCTMDGDPVNVGGNALFGRVFKFDPDAETMAQVGVSTWGSHSGGLVGGAPGALAWFAGRLFAFGATYQSGVAPRVYSIRPGVDEDWTLDDSTLAAGHSYTGAKVYKGELYATTRGAAGVSSIVRKRTTAGVWSTVRTNASSTVANSYMGMAVINSLLTVIERNNYDGVGGDNPKIFSYDGTTFTQRVDLRTAFYSTEAGAGLSMGGVLEYDGAVYYLSNAMAPGDGGLCLRTTDGTSYTAVYNTINTAPAQTFRYLFGVLRD